MLGTKASFMAHDAVDAVIVVSPPPSKKTKLNPTPKAAKPPVAPEDIRQNPRLPEAARLAKAKADEKDAEDAKLLAAQLAAKKGRADAKAVRDELARVEREHRLAEEDKVSKASAKKMETAVAKAKAEAKAAEAAAARAAAEAETVALVRGGKANTDAITNRYQVK